MKSHVEKVIFLFSVLNFFIFYVLPKTTFDIPLENLKTNYHAVFH